MAIFMTADIDVGLSKERKILQRGKEKKQKCTNFQKLFHNSGAQQPTTSAKIRHVLVF